MRDARFPFELVVFFDRGRGWCEVSVWIIGEAFSYSILVSSNFCGSLDLTFENVVVNIPSAIWKELRRHYSAIGFSWAMLIQVGQVRQLYFLIIH